MNLFVLVSILLISIADSDTCQQLCASCVSDACMICYSDFDYYASTIVSDPCECPEGYFLNSTSNICNFCPARCKSCISESACTDCLFGYKLNGGQCIMDSTTNAIEVSLDLDNEDQQLHLSPKFHLTGSAQTNNISNYFRNCSGMIHQPFYGIEAFDFDTVIIKTYYGLPHHDWANLKIQYAIVDSWEGDSFIIEVESGKNHHWDSFGSHLFQIKKDYNENIRRNSFCGVDRYGDSLGIYDKNFIHKDSILKFRISLDIENPGTEKSEQLMFGIRQVLLVVGTCPENCLTCVSSTRCGSCKELFKLEIPQFTCSCDLDEAILTQRGCIKKCEDDQVYVEELKKCLQCSLFIWGCQECDSDDKICEQCSLGYFLFNGTCVSQCPWGFQQTIDDDDNFECEECPDNCSGCVGSFCQFCDSGYWWFEGRCIEECPIGTYYEYQDESCERCSIGCIDCFSKRYCLECEDSSGILYENIGGQCKVICNQTFQIAGNWGCDITCDSKCETCYGPNDYECLSCVSPYFLQNYSCLLECEDGYYQQFDECRSCPQECSECNYHECTQCSIGYWKYKGQCLRQCPVLYYHDVDGGCLRCQEGCYKCFNSQICQECENNWLLMNGVCVDHISCPESYYFQPQFLKCFECPEDCTFCQKTLCLQCEDDTYLDNGKCVDECPRDKYPKDGRCLWKSPLCQIYSNSGNGECDECSYLDPSLVLYNECLFSCPGGLMKSVTDISICTVVCPEDCTYCNSDGFCTLCQIGFVVSSSGECVQECDVSEMSDSIQCLNCKIGCIHCQIDGLCFECQDGKYLNSMGDCIDIDCVNSDKDTAGYCVNCYSICKSCTNESSECTSCFEGKYLTSIQTCESSCQSGYFEDDLSRQCRKCQPQCLQCNSFTVCTECVSGFYLQNHKCLVECSPGYFIYPEQKLCTLCSETCQTCYGSTINHCLTCYKDYKLDHSRCVFECKSGQYEDQYGHCDKCHQICDQCWGPADFQCKTCENGTNYYEGSCTDICPQFTYEDMYHECLPCPPGCVHCNVTSCFSCETSLTYMNGQCLQIDFCPQGTFYDFTLNNCTTCSDSLCEHCTETGCVKCHDPYYRLDKGCVTACPIRFYEVNHIFKQCLHCPAHCENCTGPNNCLTCQSNFKLQDGMCTTKCNVANYYNVATSQCENCSSHCRGCSSASMCSSCGYYILSDGFCFPFCSLGYYPTEAGICVVCPPSCLTCESETMCLECQPQYTLTHGYCIQDDISYNVSCSQRCSECADSYNCIFCMIPYYLLGGNCLQSCPRGFYEYGRECQLCNSTCGSCEGSYKNCSSCKAGFSLYGNKCIQNCPLGYYSTPNLICERCSENCRSCHNDYACFKCESTYILVDGYCEQSCPIRRYYYPDFDRCLNCSVECRSCIDYKMCTDCDVGKYLHNFTCYHNCPPGTYSVNISKCFPCQYPCQQCSNAHTCLSCKPGYHLNISECVLSCGLTFYADYDNEHVECESCSPNCLSCETNSTTCTSCRYGHYLVGTKCVLDCPLSTYESYDGGCRSCSQFCIHCVNADQCELCHHNLILFEGVCIQKCLQGYSNTSAQLIINLDNRVINHCEICLYPCKTCFQISTYNCSSCYQGYFFYSGRCLQECPLGMYGKQSISYCMNCPQHCLQCTSFQNCTSCKYTANPLNGECVPLVDCDNCSVCEDTCKYCQNSTCIQCFENYYEFEGDCIQDCPISTYSAFGSCHHCSYGCFDCQSAYECIQCETTFYYLNGKCVTECPLSTILNDMECIIDPCLSKTDNICHSCISPFMLLDGVCVDECIQGYYKTSSVCQPCPDECVSCENYHNCTTCVSTSFKYQNKCLIQCIIGTYADSGHCLNCNSSCLSCVNQNTCETCLPGTYLYDGNCHNFCPPSYYEQDSVYTCQHCPDSCIACDEQYCLHCESSKVLLNGSCIQQCREGTYEVTTTSTFRICQLCPFECASCLSFYECMLCAPGYFLWQNECVERCPPSTFYEFNNGNNQCVECISPCQKCSSAENCLKCESGFYLFDGQCLTACPEHFYHNENSNCKACNPVCRQCSLISQNCISCMDGMNLVSGTCTSECAATLYNDPLNLVCESCSNNCFECYGPRLDQCLSCRYPLVLLDGICVQYCPPQLFEVSGQCRICSQNCLTCSFTSVNCTSCFVPFFLSDNECVLDCPEGYYEQSQQCKECHETCVGCKGPGPSSCESCVSPLILMTSGKCLEDCLPPLLMIDGVCDYCQIQFCQQCNGTYCVDCFEGHYLLQGDCVQECPLAYYNSNGNCELCEVSQCLKCVQNGTICTVCSGSFVQDGECVHDCSSGYSLFNGQCILDDMSCETLILADTFQCVTQCPDKYYKDYTMCMLCGYGCEYCESEDCLMCQTNFFEFEGSCGSECPQGYIGIQKQCIACQSPCQTCSGSIQYCTSCLNHTYLLNGECLSECSKGYDEDSTSMTCRKCPANCEECENSTCTVCKNQLYNAPECVDVDNSCSTSQYLEEVANCQDCHSSCLTCFNPSMYSCLSCEGGKVLLDGQCRSACPAGYIVQGNSCEKCSNMIPNCKDCSSNETCLKCEPEFILFQNQCLRSCSELNNGSHTFSKKNSTCVICPQDCSVCSQGSCLSCRTGYYLYQNECLAYCPQGTYSNARECIICSSPCHECISEDECLTCEDTTKYAYDYQCLNSCPSGTYAEVNKTCSQCQINNCEQCQQNTSSAVNISCLVCSSPYVVKDGKCEDCEDGYYFSSISKTCKECDLSCQTCLNANQCEVCASGLLYLDGECLSTCPTGYYPDSSVCERCSYSHCMDCTSSECLECEGGYFLNDGSCVSECPSGMFSLGVECEDCQSNCMTCNSDTACLQCQSSYYLYESHCYANCPSGTSSVNGTCEDCRSGCQLCSNQTNTCDTCSDNLVPEPDGTCAYNASNTTCTSGQYLSGGDCHGCYFLCKECYGGSPNKCLQCADSTYNLVNGYCLSSCSSHQYYDTSINGCTDCDANCKQCDSEGCLSCYTGNVLRNHSCQNNCPVGTYKFNLQCKDCPQHCETCVNDNYCETCLSSGTIYYDNLCYSECPTGTYQDGTNSCFECPQECYSCSSSSNCTVCIHPNKYLQGQCLPSCPSGYYTDSNICLSCLPDCIQCDTANVCLECDVGTSLLNDNCVDDCLPDMYSANKVCYDCPSNCASCESATYCIDCLSGFYYLWISDSDAQCLTSCPTNYEVENTTCINENCVNCSECIDGICEVCMENNYLYSDGCDTSCPFTYYGKDQTWTCEPCIDNCLECPNDTFCTTCIDSYNFTLDTGCVEESYLIFGALSNMSGFTSNITKITSTVYLSTSVGPVAFGQIASTYFNIEFCQFLLFHDSAAGQNEEMKNFLESLSFMAGTSQVDSTSATRRFLQTGTTTSFLEANMVVFILIGAFLFLYLIITLLHRNLDSMCLSCPKLNFYTTEICVFMQKRFKWIYFDFIVWLSYLPFLYFALLQVQNFSFDDALLGISSILSVVILATYPLYPLFICYQIKTNYRAICLENDKLTEMSLSPYISKVKRPSQIPDQGEFRCCGKENFRLVYYPLKYFRKFLFVLIVAIVTVPTISLSVLIGLNVLFIVYMAVLLPRTMPYMIFDFIIEGVLLGFQIFMLVYISLDETKVTAMSIATQAIGFLTANISIVIAIVLNIIAYYHIIKCIYDLVVVLRQKMEEKEKNDLKEKGEWSDQGENLDEMRSTPEHHIHNLEKEMLRENIKKVRNDDDLTDQDIKTENLSDEGRNIAKFMNDKDLIMNGIQPRVDDIEQTDSNNLFNDKELMEGMTTNKDKRNKNGENDDDQDNELPVFKNRNKKEKDKSNRKRKDKGNKNIDQVNQLEYNDHQNTSTRLKLKNKGIEDEEDLQYYQREGKGKNKHKVGRKEEEVEEYPTKQRSKKKLGTGNFIKVNENSSNEGNDFYSPVRNKNDNFSNNDSNQFGPNKLKLKQKDKGSDNYSYNDLASNDSLMFQESSTENLKMLDRNKKQKEKSQNNLNEGDMKQRKGRKVQDEFDDFMEDNQEGIKTYQKNKSKKRREDEVQDLDTYENKKKIGHNLNIDGQIDEGKYEERNRKSKKKISSYQGQDELDEGRFKEKKRNKNREDKGKSNDQKQENVNEGEFKERKNKKPERRSKQQQEKIRQIQMRDRQRIRREQEEKTYHSVKQNQRNISEGIISERDPKNKLKSIHQQQQQYGNEPQELKGVEREKKNANKKGFFSNLFGLNNNSDVEEKNKEEIKKKSQKKLGEDDDFEESGYGSKKNISKDEKKNRGRGNLKMNEEAAEEYEQIKRKNKESMIKPKTKSGKFNVHEDDNDFNDEEWRRPSGRNSKVSNKDEGLNVENRSDISDSEDIGVHQMRKRIQNRKKVVNKGNINIHDKLSSFNDDLEYQRPKKQEEKKNRQKHGLLKIEGKRESEDEDDLQNIQL